MAKMTNKQLKAKLRIAELPTNGSRIELERRFNEFRKQTLAEAGMSSSDEEEEGEDHKASDFPALVMVDEQTGNST